MLVNAVLLVAIPALGLRDVLCGHPTLPHTHFLRLSAITSTH